MVHPLCPVQTLFVFTLDWFGSRHKTVDSLFYKVQSHGPCSLSLVIVAWLWTLLCAMRGLLILAVLFQGLFATDPSFSKLNASEKADEAEYLINKLHHHGYKFKLFSYTEDVVSINEVSEQKTIFKTSYVPVFVHDKSLHTFKRPVTLCRVY